MTYRIKERYSEYVPIKGSRLIHDVRPQGPNKLLCRKYSSCSVETSHAFRKKLPPIDEVLSDSYKAGEFVTLLVDTSIVTGMIERYSETESEFQVTLMQKPYKGQSYKWPDPQRHVAVSELDLICKMTPTSTSNGRTYTYDSTELAEAYIKGKSLLAKLKIQK